MAGKASVVVVGIGLRKEGVTWEKALLGRLGVEEALQPLPRLARYVPKINDDSPLCTKQS